MTDVKTPIARKEGKSELIKEGSWGTRPIGDKGTEWKWTMELFDVKDEPMRGYIEWDIPDAEEYEEIGLNYDIVDGKRVLIDYDGIMSLPLEAAALIEEAGIIVGEEFKS